MISAVLPSVKPMPAAAQPEYELSIETTTGMSAPPIGMIISTPSASATMVISQNQIGLEVMRKTTISATSTIAKRDMQQVPAGQQDRLAAHASVELGEGDDRAGKGEGADGDAEAHLDQALAADAIALEDAERLRRIERRRRHEHRRQADQRVERRDQLRHLRHLDSARHDTRRCRRQWRCRR